MIHCILIIMPTAIMDGQYDIYIVSYSIVLLFCTANNIARYGETILSALNC